METFEETSRITNISATMFPSLPRALDNSKHMQQTIADYDLIMTASRLSHYNTPFYILVFLLVVLVGFEKLDFALRS
jgi:hypothetical protein